MTLFLCKDRLQTWIVLLIRPTRGYPNSRFISYTRKMALAFLKLRVNLSGNGCSSQNIDNKSRPRWQRWPRLSGRDHAWPARPQGPGPSPYHQPEAAETNGVSHVVLYMSTLSCLANKTKCSALEIKSKSKKL